MIKEEHLREMIARDENNLNLFWNERRCVLLALIFTNFDLEESWKLNAPEIEFSSYRRKIYRLNLNLKTLKQQSTELK